MTLVVAGRTIPSPLVLSPMVDVTDAAFRSVAREWDADITCSEMVSAAGLARGDPKTWRLVRRWPTESPYGVQVMGGEPDGVAEAVRRLGDRGDCDFVDLNLGCPSPNILRACAGGFLLRDPRRAGKVIRAAKEAADEVGIRDVSVKMRMGHDHEHLTYLQVGKEAQAAGASWVVLHGRTVEQGYTGRADWDAIARLVDRLDIPVVGNGDIREPDDVVRMRDETACAGFFIARAAMRDPTVFRRMRQALDGRVPDAPPPLSVRLATFLEYLDRAATLGLQNVGDLRRQAMRFASGAPGAKALRVALHETDDAASVRAVVVAWGDRAAADDGDMRAGMGDALHTAGGTPPKAQATR